MDSVINLAGNEEISIRDLAKKIAVCSGYHGSIVFDSNKPNGARRKALDDSYWRGFGWKPVVDMNEGLKNYIGSFQAEL